MYYGCLRPDLFCYCEEYTQYAEVETVPIADVYIIAFFLLKKHVQAADALTRGLKGRRRYRWYGVWDIWRRILFVAANLFISVTTRNVVLVGDCVHNNYECVHKKFHH